MQVADNIKLKKELTFDSSHSKTKFYYTYGEEITIRHLEQNVLIPLKVTPTDLYNALKKRLNKNKEIILFKTSEDAINFVNKPLASSQRVYGHLLCLRPVYKVSCKIDPVEKSNSLSVASKQIIPIEGKLIEKTKNNLVDYGLIIGEKDISTEDLLTAKKNNTPFIWKKDDQIYIYSSDENNQWKLRTVKEQNETLTPDKKRVYEHHVLVDKSFMGILENSLQHQNEESFVGTHITFMSTELFQKINLEKRLIKYSILLKEGYNNFFLYTYDTKKAEWSGKKNITINKQLEEKLKTFSFNGCTTYCFFKNFWFDGVWIDDGINVFPEFIKLLREGFCCEPYPTPFHDGIINICRGNIIYNGYVPENTKITVFFHKSKKDNKFIKNFNNFYDEDYVNTMFPL